MIETLMAGSIDVFNHFTMAPKPYHFQIKFS